MQTREELLIEAARSNNITDVETLIQNGANVNFRDDNNAACALDVAAEQGHCSVIRILLRAGARVDGVRLSREYNYLTTDDFRIQKFVFYEKTARDYSPLIRAVRGGHIDAVRILINAGADISFSIYNSSGNYSGNALSIAVKQLNNIPQEHQIAIIKALLPAADRSCPHLRRRAVDIAEALIGIASNGDRIYVNSGGERIYPQGGELNSLRRNDAVAQILRNYGTFQDRLNHIPNFDERNLTDDERIFYESIIDPITQEIINDPVKVSSRQLYDNQSLMDFFRRHINPDHYPELPETLPCPITRLPISKTELFLTKDEDILIRNQINDFITRQEQNNLILINSRYRSNFLIACALAVTGIALLITAFVILDAASLGLVGTCVAALGVVAILGSIGFYRATPRQSVSTHNPVINNVAL